MNAGLLATLLAVSTIGGAPAAAASGDIRTIAGIEWRDNVPATQTQLNWPSDVTLAPDGDVVIADEFAGRIRRVDAQTGLISTIAGTSGPGLYVVGLPLQPSGDGGPATEARLYPSSVAYDSAGDLIVADAGNHRIRKIDASGTITNIVGTGVPVSSGDGGPAHLAGVSTPQGLTFDGAGNLYIVEGERVRKVDAATNTITTIAGIDSPTSGVAVGPITVTTSNGDFGPAILARLDSPTDVAVASNGDVYIAEGGRRVRKVDALSGIITTLAGRNDCAYSGDGGPAWRAHLCGVKGLAIDGSRLLIGDSANGRVRVVNLATNIITTVIGGGSIWPPDDVPALQASVGNVRGLLVDGNGNIVVAHANRVSKVGQTGLISRVAGSTGDCAAPGADGSPASAASFCTVQDVAVGPDGTVYALDFERSTIRAIDLDDGTIRRVAGGGSSTADGMTATDALLKSPRGIGIDHLGNLLIAETSASRIRKVDAITGLISTVAGTGGPGYSGDGGPASQAGMAHPYDVASDAAGNIFIADSSNCRVRRVDGASGVISTVAGNGECVIPFLTQGLAMGDGLPATLANVFYPYGVDVDAAGNVYLADATDRIRRVDHATGIIQTIAGLGTRTGVIAPLGDGGPGRLASLSYPYHLDVTAGGDVYFADAGNNRIRRIDAQTGAITTVAGSGAYGFGGDGGPATSARLSFPSGVALAPDGSLYIADTYNGRVRVVDPS